MKNRSAGVRIVLHSFFLISLNLFSVMAAVLFLHFVGEKSDEFWQTIAASLINLGLYVIIFKLMYGIQKEVMKIDDFSMLSIILISSLALFPAVFYPLHFLTKGYWNTFDNILEFWPFQLIVNALCLVLNHYFLSKSKS